MGNNSDPDTRMRGGNQNSMNNDNRSDNNRFQRPMNGGPRGNDRHVMNKMGGNSGGNNGPMNYNNSNNSMSGNGNNNNNNQNSQPPRRNSFGGNNSNNIISQSDLDLGSDGSNNLVSQMNSGWGPTNRKNGPNFQHNNSMQNQNPGTR